MSPNNNYTEDNIRSLDWKEHIRMRPGMYIGKLGDGSSPDDGIYILLKEVLDNSIDEFVMGAGRTIEVSINQTKVTVRDFGRGIPLGKVVDVVSKMNTGGKYDSKAFKKAVGLNGVGTKAVNALSDYFRVESTRDGYSVAAEFNQGSLINHDDKIESSRRKGTKVTGARSFAGSAPAPTAQHHQLGQLRPGPRHGPTRQHHTAQCRQRPCQQRAPHSPLRPTHRDDLVEPRYRRSPSRRAPWMQALTRANHTCDPRPIAH